MYQVTSFKMGEKSGCKSIGNTFNFDSWNEARAYISNSSNHNTYRTQDNEWRTPWLPAFVEGTERTCTMYRIDEFTA